MPADRPLRHDADQPSRLELAHRHRVGILNEAVVDTLSDSQQSF
jgi:hypothetical protein